MLAAVGQLVASARAAMRPKWSQRFLAEELTLRGYPTTRSQITRLENSEATLHDAELLAAAALILQIPDESVLLAIVEDYARVRERVTSGLAQRTSSSRPSNSPHGRA